MMRCSVSIAQRWIFAQFTRVHDVMGEIPYHFSLTAAMTLTQMRKLKSSQWTHHPTLTLKTTKLIIKSGSFHQTTNKTCRAGCALQFHPRNSQRKTSKSSSRPPSDWIQWLASVACGQTWILAGWQQVINRPQKKICTVLYNLYIYKYIYICLVTYSIIYVHCTCLYTPVKKGFISKKQRCLIKSNTSTPCLPKSQPHLYCPPTDRDEPTTLST